MSRLALTKPLRVVAGTALVFGLAIAAHIGSTGLGSPDLNTIIALVPLLLAVLMLPFCRGGWRMLVAACMLGLVLYFAWPLLRKNVPLLYLLQHLGINLSLAALFGRSLLSPNEALITRLARLLRGSAISQREIHYTRGVTRAWTMFFLANANISLLLYVFASTDVWSVYANFLGWPLTGVMFFGETLLRRRALPPEERPGLADVVRAWNQHAATRRDAVRPPVSGA
ncbi:MAG TPA: hypothetical protein VL550_05115 [Rhodocyclaceae bacterium]|nr:hypothetical protein [Rhodocyclaceae bacterium]